MNDDFYYSHHVNLQSDHGIGLDQVEFRPLLFCWHISWVGFFLVIAVFSTQWVSGTL